MSEAPVLVIGKGGQLSTALAEQAGELKLVQIERPELDLVRPETVAPALDGVRPSLVINAAAYTAVDRAESERDLAWAVNATGPGAIAAWCGAAGVPLIHVSTDYVFDGNKGAPYVETDPPHPTGVYGASKRAGEEAVLAACPMSAILRTAWVYAPAGRNFMLTMLAARQKTDTLRVVADQIGCPTAAGDLAAAILGMVRRIREGGWQDSYAGLYHAAGTGETSWFEFARAIFEEAARFGVTPPTIIPIATADWPTPVRRPPDSRLDCSRLEAVFGIRLPPWRVTLAKTIDAVFSPQN